MSTARVDFTRGAAERIAAVVRRVEQGDRDGTPLTFGKVDPPPGGKVFRVCRYTGAWSLGSSKVVTFRNQTSTPNTVSAVNLFLPLPDRSGTVGLDCAIAKDGGTWYLIQAQFASAQFMVDVNVGTNDIQFTRHVGLSLGTSATVAISVTTCATAS